jgi:adenine/guanine phosphoribosyltransferase-like PRPP-binding protein
MVKQVSHTVAGADPAGLALALAVAHELHAPVKRAPEVAPAAATPRRTKAAHTRRRTPARG